MKRDFRFMPSLESLDERANPSALAGTPDAASEGPVVLEGQQCLVFYLGGTPSHADSEQVADGRKYKLLVAPLIVDLDAHAVVDRVQLAEAPAQSQPAGNVYTVTFGGSLGG